jgi:hypothetical protein
MLLAIQNLLWGFSLVISSWGAHSGEDAMWSRARRIAGPWCAGVCRFEALDLVTVNRFEQGQIGSSRIISMHL